MTKSLNQLWDSFGGGESGGRVFVGIDVVVNGAARKLTHLYKGYGNIFAEDNGSSLSHIGKGASRGAFAKGHDTLANFMD